jgi:hypothetical protein
MNPLYRQGAHQNQTKDLESFDIKNIKKNIFIFELVLEEERGCQYGLCPKE